MFYNITRAVTIAFNAKKCGSLVKSAETILSLYYSVNHIRKKYQGVLS